MTNPVTAVSSAIDSFFDWLKAWQGSKDARKDKESIKIGQKLSEKVQRLNITDVYIRANWGEVQQEINECKELAYKFFRSLD